MKKKLVHGAIMSVFMGSAMPLISTGLRIGFSADLIMIWISILPKAMPIAFILGWIFGPIATKITNKIIK